MGGGTGSIRTAPILSPYPSTGAKAQNEEQIAPALITQTWGFDQLPAKVRLRGGGCASSMLCESSRSLGYDEEPIERTEKSNRSQVEEQEPAQQSLVATADTTERPASPAISWPGWAELENDPEIFTILLQEWGVPNLHVQEITDLADLITAAPHDTLGLIFLSRYAAAADSENVAATPESSPSSSTQPPWFANQISKFSCGTVALMNILMNSSTTNVSETLSSFKHSTDGYSAKERGIALDQHSQFREIHNSFSTVMDRMIVDVLLKDDAQKFARRKAAEARAAKQAESGKAQKRKRGTGFTRKKKRRSIVDEEDDNGFHFVAYVPANGAVWKMDGLKTEPGCLGKVENGQTWLNVSAQDLYKKMNEAFNSGEDCSLMSVSRTDVPMAVMTEAERTRKQEDWAPFIEHMLRLHAEKGDLQEMLGL